MSRFTEKALQGEADETAAVSGGEVHTAPPEVVVEHQDALHKAPSEGR
jgi:hypothetical protein